jgi:energy-coupling factor transport system ATP-binding protein
MLIEVENLVHTYALGTPLEHTALCGVSLEIGPGERVGIAGRTGSGKSTFVQHLAGLLKPTAGRVTLDRVTAHRRTAEARAQRRRVGIALQYPEDQIFEQTVFREVAFGPRNFGLKDKELDVRVRWALEMVGLDAVAVEGRVPFTLSGGETRRVALASILAMQPEVLILDEPTAGLDPQGRRDLLLRVQAWHAETDLTLVMVSHDLDALARMAERVILIDGGRIAADGPVRQVLSDSEQLRVAGLDLPEPVELLQMLRKAGWAVRTDRLLPEEAAAEIAEHTGLRLAGNPMGSGGER